MPYFHGRLQNNEMKIAAAQPLFVIAVAQVVFSVPHPETHNICSITAQSKAIIAKLKTILFSFSVKKMCVWVCEREGGGVDGSRISTLRCFVRDQRTVSSDCVTVHLKLSGECIGVMKLGDVLDKLLHRERVVLI